MERAKSITSREMSQNPNDPRIGNLLAELVPILKDLQQKSNDSQDAMLGVLQDSRKRSFEIVFFNYPNDGTLGTITTGTTVLDFRAGTVKIPDGTVSRMSSNLVEKQKDFLRSASIYCNKVIAIQFDEDDKAPVLGDHWLTQNQQQFSKISLTATEDTKVLVSVSTNPNTSMRMESDSAVTIGSTSTHFGADVYGSLVTDDEVHFTDALPQDGAEMEVVPGLLANKMFILDIRISSKQNLNYQLWVFGGAGSAFSGTSSIDMTSALLHNGMYYKTFTINSLYTGHTPVMFLMLVNLDAVTKLAGADGAITMDFSYKALA